MGFLKRFSPSRAIEALTTPPVPALQLPPDPWKGADFPTERTPGYYISSTVAELCKRAVVKMKEIPNAQAGDVDIFVEAAWGAYRLGQTLEQVDAELIRCSNGALKWTLDEYTPWNWRRARLSMMIRGPYHRPRLFDYHPEDAEKNGAFKRKPKRGEVAPHVKRADKEAREWVDAHLADQERYDFLALLDRRLELRASAQAALDEFRATCAEIDRDHDRAQATASVQTLDRELLLAGQTEYELENVREGSNDAKALTAGLDAVWPVKTAPDKSRRR